MRKFPKFRTLTGDKKLKKFFGEPTNPIPFFQPVLRGWDTYENLNSQPIFLEKFLSNRAENL